MFRTQMALEEELGTCKPTVFQGNSMTILLNAVRVWQNNYYSVLCLIQSISVALFLILGIMPRTLHRLFQTPLNSGC